MGKVDRIQNDENYRHIMIERDREKEKEGERVHITNYDYDEHWIKR